MRDTETERYQGETRERGDDELKKIKCCDTKVKTVEISAQGNDFSIQLRYMDFILINI